MLESVYSTLQSVAICHVIEEEHGGPESHSQLRPYPSRRHKENGMHFVCKAGTKVPARILCEGSSEQYTYRVDGNKYPPAAMTVGFINSGTHYAAS
jgi:hypothetical protein